MLYALPANAVHDDGVFQLDRNAQASDPGSPATTGEDWDMVCPTTTPAGAVSCIGGTTADASFFKTDQVVNRKDTTLYTGGSTKDDLDVPGWAYTSGAGPDKDDLGHGFAARYDDLIYFGTDRFSASGDSTVGLWLFQADVGPNGSGGFTGQHVNGDVLVLSDFTNGGAAVTARVYRWHSPGGAIDGTLDLIQGTENPPTVADCVGPPAVPNGDFACATVNTENENSPWAFNAKEHGFATGVFPKGHFFEGGIDLAGLNLAEECFSSVILESRASQSTDSVLKDFIGGSFQHCSATMTTAPSSGSVSPGTAVHDVATVNGNQPTKTPTGSVDFFLCSFAVGSTATCDGTTNVGVSIGSGTLSGSGGIATANSPDVNTAAAPLAPGHYCFRAHYGGDVNYTAALDFDGAAECFEVTVVDTAILTVQPAFYPNDSATVSTANASLLPAGGNVTFSLYDSLANCNTGGATGRLYGPEQKSITGGTLTETVSTSNTTVTLNSANTAYWRVVYTTGSSAYANRESKCVENVTHNITDDPGPGTVP